MKICTFKKGIHPHDEKSKTEKLETKYIIPKEGSIMVYPMAQHLGSPANPLVAVGDYVKIGQKIGEASGFISANIHSSVCGTVKSIAPVLTPSGSMSNAITIVNDGKIDEDESVVPCSDYTKLTNDEIIGKIKEAGIVGLGGAGFPTHVKLSPPPDKKIDYILMNAAECEPFLTSDHRVMLEESERLITGVKIILKLHPQAKAIIGIETNKMDAIAVMEKACKNENNIEVVGLTPKYPQGSEKQLILACTGRVVPSGGLPSDVGVIVNNVDTVLAIERAIVHGKPILRRVVTISGGAIAEPGNYRVRIGMSYTDLIEEVGGFTTVPKKLISGGPMMGIALAVTDIPIVKTSSALLCLTAEEAITPDEKKCIRCGKCIDACPMNLMPMMLNQIALLHEEDEFKANNGLDCIECGSCSYVCPSKRHLAQTIRACKKTSMANKKKA